MTEALAAAPQAVPIDPNAAPIPNPAESSVPQKEAPDEIGQPPSGKERKSIEQIIKDSHAKVTKEAAEKEAKPEPKAEGKDPAKPEAKAEPKAEPKAKEPAKEPAKASHGPDGKFVSTKEPEPGKEPAKPDAAQSPHREPPARFSADAKAEWETAPESVKAETHRAVRELEAGLGQYREAARAYEEIKDYDHLARQAGTTVRKAMEQYISLDMNLRSEDPAVQERAIAHIFQHAGVDPHEWAARLLDQPPEQRQTEQNQTIRELRDHITRLEQTVGGVTKTIQQQQATATIDSVAKFANDNPRFDELSAAGLEYNIQNILRSDLVPKDIAPQDRLQKAYELADRLNPSATKPEPLTPASEPAKEAGNKSIGGAPASGSDPAIPARKPDRPSSISENIKRAKAKVFA